MRSVVTFESGAFNVTEARDYFINPACFGDDVAKWLIGRLRQAGFETDEEPGQEDFEWYFEFRVAEGEHCCVIGYRPGDGADPGVWIAWLERSRGLLGSLFMGRNRGIADGAIGAIHKALSGPSEISNLRWHTKDDFDRGREELGSAVP